MLLNTNFTHFERYSDILLLDSIDIDVSWQNIYENDYSNLVKLLKKDAIDMLGIRKCQLMNIIDDVKDILISGNKLKTLAICNDKGRYDSVQSSQKYIRYMKNILLKSNIKSYWQGGYSDIDIELIRSIAHNKSITYVYLYQPLDIDSNKLYNGLIYMINNNQILTSLKIENFIDNTISIEYFKKFCSAISNHKIFEDIDFSSNKIDGKKLKVLCKALQYNKSLKELFLGIISVKDCVYIKKLLKYVNLITLEVESNDNYILEYMLNIVKSDTSINTLRILTPGNIIKLSHTLINLLTTTKICNIYADFTPSKQLMDVVNYNGYICSIGNEYNNMYNDICNRNKYNILQKNIMLQQLLKN